MVLVELATLLASVAFLSKSASVVVENASKISAFFGIGQVALGFLLISILTTLPELSVSVISSTIGKGSLAAGNVFGSMIANILLILGLGGFLYGFKVKRSELVEIALILLVTTIVSAYIIFTGSIRGNVLDRLEGVILLLLFIIYSHYLIATKKTAPGTGQETSKKEALEAFLYFAAGIGVVLVSAGLVVDSAVKLASLLGLAESFIGSTIIAVGTSLPELSVSLHAIRRKHYGIALGDTIGANMTNLTMVLGVAALINPVSVVLHVFSAALLFAIVANVFLFYAASVNRGLGKVGGALFIFTYLAYLAVIFYLQLSELGAQ